VQSAIVKATVITVVSYDRKNFIVQATLIIRYCYLYITLLKKTVSKTFLTEEKKTTTQNFLFKSCFLVS
jgi:hypothetical protein